MERCDICNKKAIWFYMPGKEQYCDECVPRGCSCNIEPKDGDYDNLDPKNWVEELDNEGREYPCCEYWKL